jgi:hypothetical protein
MIRARRSRQLAGKAPQTPALRTPALEFAAAINDLENAAAQIAALSQAASAAPESKLGPPELRQYSSTMATVADQLGVTLANLVHVVQWQNLQGQLTSTDDTGLVADQLTPGLGTESSRIADQLGIITDRLLHVGRTAKWLQRR